MPFDRFGRTFFCLALWCCVAPASIAETQSAQWLHLQAEVPGHWQAETPSSSMRLAQYRIPGGGDRPPGAFVIYYFGPGQGGTAQANIARWQSQFSAPQGGAVEAEIDSFDRHGLKITRARLDGNYARGVGMGPQGAALPDHTLIAAVVESPDHRIILQLYGPRDVIAREVEGFDLMLQQLRPRS